MSDTPRRYRAFLSYRHSDNTRDGRRWAGWLQRELERYEVPVDLIEREKEHGHELPKTLYPVFRDEDSLPAGHDLEDWIRRGLERSEAMIVLCSPRSVKSKYVSDEIRQFKALGKGHRIFALLIDGEPNASAPGQAEKGVKPEEECFPRELRFGVADSVRTVPEGHPEIDWDKPCGLPLAADVRLQGTRAEGFTSPGAYREHLEQRGSLSPAQIDERVAAYEERLRVAVCKLIAGLLDVDLEDIRKRDAEQRAREAQARAEEERQRAITAEKLAAAERGIAEEATKAAEAERQRAAAAEELLSVQRKTARILFALMLLILAAGVAAFRMRSLAIEAAGKYQSESELRRKNNETASARLLAEAQDHGNNGRWYRSVQSLSTALEFQQDNQEAAALLWNQLLSPGKDRFALPDRVYAIPAKGRFVNLAATRPVLLLMTGESKFQFYDYEQGKGSEPFALEGESISLSPSPNGDFVYSYEAGRARVIIATVENLTPGSFTSLPEGWELPSNFRSSWQNENSRSSWQNEKILLQNMTGLRWWNAKTKQWDSDEMPFAEGKYFYHFFAEDQRFIWSDLGGLKVGKLDDLPPQLLEVNTAFRSTFIISGDGHAVLTDKFGFQGDTPSAVDVKSIGDFKIYEASYRDIAKPDSISHDGRYALVNHSDGRVSLHHLPTNQLQHWSQGEPPAPKPFGESAWRFHPLENKLWTSNELGDLCFYDLPSCPWLEPGEPHPPAPTTTPGVDILPFIRLAQPPVQERTIAALCIERDRLHKELDMPGSFPSLPKEWRDMLRWWTSKPGERKAKFW